jgi:NAD(P)H-nitrite reductase large subunit
MASVRLVEELVARGVGELTVLGDERHAPYNRILLSAVLEGTHRPAALTLRDPGWYRSHGVDLRLGTRAVALHRGRRVLELADATVVPYDRLVLATGARPVLPPIRGLVRPDGTMHPRVYAFRTLDDCARLLAALPSARRAVVVGGGLLGLQVARALAVRGIETEVVEGGEHLLRGNVDSRAGRVLERSLTRLGTRVYTGVRAVRLTDVEPGGPEAVDGPVGLGLDDGFVLETDLVVLAAGSAPAVDLAERAGLAVGRAVLVDDQLRTSDPRIHAVGDCAEHTGRAGLPLAGFVPPAWEQAEALAAHLAGEPAAYRGTRMVARLRATDLEVAVLGDPGHAKGEPVEVTNPLRGAHRKLVVRDGVVVAGTLVGDLSRLGVISKAFDHATVLGTHEPGALLLPEPTARQGAELLADDTEVCVCAGVTAGRIRACGGLTEVRETTRATTGCGGCAGVVQQLLAAKPQLVRESA